MTMMDGHVALVTGSTSGIGEACARLLAQHGATVVVNSARSVDAGRQLAADLDGTYVQADVADPDAAAKLVDVATRTHGRLDVVINNAGWTKVIPHRDLESASDDVWRRILDTNLMGTWHVSRVAAPWLRRDGGGSIVNITSIAGLRAIGSSIPYAVSKAAVNHLTVLLAKALGPDIRVNAVAPGLIDTPWTAGWDEIRAQVRQSAALERSGKPDDIAQACLALVRAPYTTGSVLVADGGLTL